MALIPKHYIDSVVSIGIRREDKSIAWIGTGFFVHRRIDEHIVLPFWVSNKHVLEHNPNVVIRMKEMTKNQLIEIDFNTEDCQFHPHAYIPYQEQLVNMQTQNVVEIRSENSGIALMHPVEFIREVIDLFYKKQ